MLVIQAGEVLQPQTGTTIEVGLPWGPKPRLILAHLNAEALRLGSPEIAVQDSLSAFVKRIRGFDGGREIRMFKDQLTRLSNAEIRLAFLQGTRLKQINTHVVTGFELWLPKDDRQRVLWPSTVRLSSEYFESLKKHAVPLNEADLGALGAHRNGSRHLRLAGAASAPYRSEKTRFYRLVESQRTIWARLQEDVQFQARISQDSCTGTAPLSDRPYRARRQGDDGAQQPTTGWQTIDAHIEPNPQKTYRLIGHSGAKTTVTSYDYWHSDLDKTFENRRTYPRSLPMTNHGHFLCKSHQNHGHFL